jgi:hypothetical protein
MTLRERNLSGNPGFSKSPVHATIIRMNHENLSQAIENLSARMIAIRDSL